MQGETHLVKTEVLLCIGSWIWVEQRRVFLEPNVALTILEMKIKSTWGFKCLLCLKATLLFPVFIFSDLKKKYNKTNLRDYQFHDSRSCVFEKRDKYLVICNKIMVFSNTSKILSILAHEYYEKHV